MSTDRDRLALLRKVVGAIPVGIGVGGRKRELAFKPLDALFRKRVGRSISTSVGPIEINEEHAPERLLAYAFENVYRHYRGSPLGRFLAAERPELFIDIGSNLGLYAMIAKSLGCRTACFEPEPSHADFLARNYMAVGVVHQVALSDTVGSLPLYYNGSNPGATSLVTADNYEPSVEEVRVDLFDHVWAEELEHAVDEHVVIKIDVEGHEASVVRGMAAALSSGFRPVLWIEVRGNGSSRAAGSWRSVRDVLSSFEYRMLDPVTGSAFQSDVVLDGRAVFDALFLPQAAVASV